MRCNSTDISAVDCPDHFDSVKESLYSYIQSAGFDSEEIWDLWYESDEDINTFIDGLHRLEAQALCRMDCEEEGRE